MSTLQQEQEIRSSFGYGFPKLSQKDNTDLEEARVNIAPVTGKTMESCVQTYDSRLEKLADCNHMKVLVFGENLMEDTGRYADVLSYLKQTGLFPRNIYVCVAEDPLALFETEEDLPQDLGSYLEQYLQNQESAGSGKLFKLTSLYNIIDSIFIGHGVGAMGIAGLAITFPLMNLVVAFCTLVSAGGSTISSIRLGQKDLDGATEVLGNTLRYRRHQSC